MNPATHRLQVMNTLKPQKLVDITYAKSQVNKGIFSVFLKQFKSGTTYPHRLINVYLKMFAK